MFYTYFLARTRQIARAQRTCIQWLPYWAVQTENTAIMTDSSSRQCCSRSCWQSKQEKVTYKLPIYSTYHGLSAFCVCFYMHKYVFQQMKVPHCEYRFNPFISLMIVCHPPVVLSPCIKVRQCWCAENNMGLGSHRTPSFSFRVILDKLFSVISCED